jgi:hypothetical protein
MVNVSVCFFKYILNMLMYVGLVMDSEDRKRYERALRKKEQAQERRRREADLEELVPKATGR